MTHKPKLGDSVFCVRWGASKECAAAIEKIVVAANKEPDDRTALAKDLDGATSYLFIWISTPCREPERIASRTYAKPQKS